MNEALAWIERAPEVPEAGFSAEIHGTHLELRVGEQITGYDITRMAELIRERYEEKGPVNLSVYTEGIPKLGPGLVYEKFRQFKLLKLINRYAVLGPDSLKTKVAAARSLLSTEVKHFLPTQSSEAVEWLLDDSPKVQLLSTERDDRFCHAIDGQNHLQRSEITL